jgi:hypothetical protein
MPPRRQTNTLKNPLSLGRGCEHQREGREEPRPPYSIRHRFSLRFDSVPGLYTARPAATFTKKPRPASSYVRTAPFLFLNIRKAPAGEDGNQNQPELAPRGLYRPVAKPPTDSKRAGAMRNFGEHHQGEVRRISLPRTRVNKGKN